MRVKSPLLFQCSQLIDIALLVLSMNSGVVFRLSTLPKRPFRSTQKYYQFVGRPKWHI